MKFGLTPEIIDQIVACFKNFPEIEQVLIFGSRAKNSFRDASDIDLAVFAPAMTHHDFAQVWAALDDLPLVFKLDCLHFDLLENSTLKKKILEEGKRIYSAH